MRVIAGKFRGRRFDIPPGFRARPTTDLARESLFNVVAGCMDLEGKRALDLFSGTGAITLEMLSRGCSSVTSVELDRRHHAFIRQCLERLGVDNCRALHRDAFRFLRTCRESFDMVFADPPYALEGLGELPGLVLGGGMVAPGGLFVLEHGAGHDFSRLPGFTGRRAYGSVNFSFFSPLGP